MSKLFEPFARGQLYKVWPTGIRNLSKAEITSANYRHRLMRYVGMKKGYRDMTFAMFRIAIRQPDGSTKTGYYESFTPWQIKDHVFEPVRHGMDKD